jgi:hypothetical protein
MRRISKKEVAIRRLLYNYSPVSEIKRGVGRMMKKNLVRKKGGYHGQVDIFSE